MPTTPANLRPMTLERALRLAENIAGHLAPYCERVTIAGSIRRCRPTCADVDLVIIPKRIEQRDLLGTPLPSRNLLHEFLADYVKATPSSHWIAGENNPDGQNLLISLAQTRLDIFQASPATWGTILLCRTGSKIHNIRFADFVKRKGGHWNPYHGLHLRDGQPLDVSEETNLYQAAGLGYLNPEQRENPSFA